VEPEGKPNMKSIDQIVEGERKHFEEEISHYRKQLEVKDRQIEYLMNQLEQKDSLLHTSMTLLRGMGVNINDKTKTDNL